MATTTETIETRASIWDRPLWEVVALDWEKVLYGVLILAAFVTRFYHLGDRVMSHDESLHTQFAWYLYQGRGFQHTPLMHGPLKFELTAFTYWLLGDDDFTARIPTALMGVAAVGLMYFFRKWLGRTGALVAALLMLISPYMLYYSRYIRDEPYVMVWALLTALCVIRYMETRAAKYLYWLTAISALFYATMESSFIYIAISMLFLGLHLVYEILSVEWPQAEYRSPFTVAFAFTVIALVVSLGFFFYSRQAGAVSGTVTAAPADPNATLTTGVSPADASRQTAGIAAVVTAAGIIAGLYFLFRGFGNEIRRFPALDVLVVFGVFVLPQLTAFPVLALGRNPVDYNLPERIGGDMPFTDWLVGVANSSPGVTLIVFVLLLAASVVIGLIWDPKKFILCAGIFYGIYLPLFTTFFTNGGGTLTGLVGSLGYWLEQHGVKRGNQPWYYYAVINVPIYEFLPAIGALFAGGLAVWRWVVGVEPAREAAPALAAADGPDGMVASPKKRPVSPSDTEGFPVVLYFGFWAAMAPSAFSIAGEKMPWLTTHIALPLILLSGWAIGQFIDATDWKVFGERRAWLLAVALPVTIVAVTSLLGALLGATPPFQGSELPQLQATGVFVSSLVVSLIGVAAVYRLGNALEWENVARLAVLSFFGLLALITARTAFIASYVNYDYANEFLVYAHGARGVKTVMAQVDEISERTQDGLGLRVAYDDAVTWPVTWYLRNYYNQAYFGKTPTRDALDSPVVIAGPYTWDKVETVLGDRYYKFEYIRMVWPMQDYFDLTWDRIRKALADPQMRQALWNIWWDRDYTLYGQIREPSENYDLSDWPVREEMRFYVRKDIAAEIWQYGVGPTVLGGGAVAEDPCEKLKQAVSAESVWGGTGEAAGLFRGPRDAAVGPDGSVYVVDWGNSRIQKFDPAGNLLLAWGAPSDPNQAVAAPGTFKEPWGVAVGPDGSVYVADTWNHRIQKFDADGVFITMWGHAEYNADDISALPFDGFYGPRAIAVDEQGRVFVADTGNMRVVIFDGNGNGLSVIGGHGFDPGLFDEPVGLALGPDATLYVADTWNQRIQAFRRDPNTDEYLFDREWPVAGWYGKSLWNKPYLDMDAQGRLYVTDPEGYRVLVFDEGGQCLAAWGDFGADTSAFALASGIAVDAQGYIYVSDADFGEQLNNRVLKFPPFK
jgi:predicted membrane-bound mannosyltransferase/DNA-binding beta-propeller fold protein YncE